LLKYKCKSKKLLGRTNISQRWNGQQDVNVIDITTMNNAQIQQAVNSSDRVICAWCYSERSTTVLGALNIP